ncbi:MAG TPA: GGDEF domain-containing protein [Gemmatimonadales bacterium]|nr:GGDEF domain-containing protein [Gemmatimonadales bacterium]
MKLPRPGVWVGRVLALLGLAAVVPAVLSANVWALVAALGGCLVALGLALPSLVRAWLADAPFSRPSDFEHVLDLMCRSYAARAGWIVGLEEGDLEVGQRGTLDPATRQRGAALVQLASVDGRAHVARDPAGTYVAVGDFPWGAGMLLPSVDAPPSAAERATEELRRLVASMRLVRQQQAADQPVQFVAKQLAAMAGGAQTLEGIAKAGVALAQQLTERGCAIILQGLGPASAEARVVAVSKRVDARLDGLTLTPDAPALRAIGARVPVASHGSEDVFGDALPDRRRRDRAGTAYPLLDGHFAIGALVVMGSPFAAGTPSADQLQRLVAELGSRLAAARALHEAEQRAVKDPLTGLRNRRELERVLGLHESKQPPIATLIYADLDHFKNLNDTLGHAAGDGALRHVARILEGAVRDKDLVARIGGEEFAIWMPHTPIESGLEVAERIRSTVESVAWRWSGEPYPLTISCGVAGYPEHARTVENLRVMADAALYRAKQGGRNRVERAQGEPMRYIG